MLTVCSVVNNLGARTSKKTGVKKLLAPPPQTPKLVGILNVTPDSFSDGNQFIEHDDALAQAQSLLEQGADLIDIGGDSSGPGSKCVGNETEWQRIGDLIKPISKFCPVSVDTHHASTAKLALEAGASVINDISAGADAEMFPVVRDRAAKIILMYSRSGVPHVFNQLESHTNFDELFVEMKSFLSKRVDLALKAGIKPENIVLDPGMGFFISSNPTISWELIKRFSELKSFELPLLLATSRKGFLRQEGENSPKDRDPLSALTSFIVAQQFEFNGPDYIRVHNVGMHKEFLRYPNLFR